MKLLYITNQVCGSGGLERVLAIKTAYLIDHYGYEIHILTLNQGQQELFYDFHPKLIYHNIEVYGNPIRYLLKYGMGLNSIVKKVLPDVISVCDDGLKGFFLPIILRKPCPMVYERHVSRNINNTNINSSLLQKLLSPIKFKLMHYCGRLYDTFVVLTAGNLKEWDLKNIKVISNPISFFPNETAILEHKTVLAVGRQSYQKGYDLLLNSWQKVSLRHPDWILKIYGKKDPTLRLVELSKTLKIEKSVLLHDPKKNIEEEYFNASIYVMSSRFEGFGMVLTEAMAYGVPVISFNCPHGPADIISHGIDGILVPETNIEMFANEICELIENKDKRKSLGINAKKNVQRYLPEVIVPQWDTLFKSLTS